MKKAQILKVFISMVLALVMVCGTNIPVFATEADDELVVTSSYNPFTTTANNTSRSIIGEDDRDIITDTDASPYRTK